MSNLYFKFKQMSHKYSIESLCCARKRSKAPRANHIEENSRLLQYNSYCRRANAAALFLWLSDRHIQIPMGLWKKSFYWIVIKL